MRNGLAAFCVFACVTSIAFGQVAPEEAAKRLRDKQAVRAAAATQPAAITAGEVEELKSEIALLRAENATLRKQIAEATAGTIAAKPKTSGPRKHYEKIEVGMTRDDLNQFLKYHPQEYRVTQDAPDKVIAVRLALMNVRTGGIAMRTEWQPQETYYLTLKDNVVTEMSR